MTKEQDDFYWNYVIARFSAYRNVWWSLANEYDLMKNKTTEGLGALARFYVKRMRTAICVPSITAWGCTITAGPGSLSAAFQRQDIYKTSELVDGVA